MTNFTFSFRPKLLECLPGYQRGQLMTDLSAGLTVGVLALPLAMAFAIASGLSPTAGIWTAIVAGFLVSALGGSRVQIGGPTGAFIPIVYGIVVQYGVANLLIATMLAGLLLMAMGVFRLGNLIRYIPVSVVIGFTNGIAVVIFLAQLKDFFGLQIASLPGEFFGRVQALLSHAHTVHLPTVALAIASLALLASWNRLARSFAPMRRLPGPLAVLVIATAVNAILQLPVETIGTRFGGIPQEIPPLALPAISLDTLGKLISPAITIALLGAIESLLSARVADSQIEDRHDPNQELIAQGVANFIAPLFGGFAATGAIARTATNVRTGGRTPVAGMAHAIVLLLVVLVAAPLARHIPLATLSAIVVMVSINMGEWHAFTELRRYSLNYRTILLTTFLVTVVFDLTLAVELGMVLASLFFIYRMSDVTQLERLPLEEFYGRDAICGPDGRARIVAYKVFGALFFGAVGKLEALMQQNADLPDVLIFDMEKCINMDTTGVDTLHTLQRQLASHGTTLVLCGLNSQPGSLVFRSGFLDALGDDNVQENLTETLIHATRLRNRQYGDMEYLSGS